jgi:hypothetical protein
MPKYGRLETTYVYPPIPERGMDWSAHEDPEGYIGRGPTELAAVIDYFEHEAEELRGELDKVEADAKRSISEGTNSAMADRLSRVERERDRYRDAAVRATEEGSRFLSYAEGLVGLLREGLAVANDLRTKTDVYLGINDATARADKWAATVSDALGGRNWTEDASHENGNYQCGPCVECGHTFIGHKRRVVCRACSTRSIPTGVSHECGEKCPHASDCALHNAPAYPAGKCDCGYEIDTQKPAPRECHNGTACTSWDCTYPNCTFPPKKPEAPLQRGRASPDPLGEALNSGDGSYKP